MSPPYRSRNAASWKFVRHRLQSQRLLGSPCRTVHDVVQWLAAVQAQDYAGAKWALGLRLRNADDHTIEAAFTDGTILRTHLLRPTWHFVTAGDIRWLLALTAPRVHAANAYMYRKTGLDGATFRRSETALQNALQGGRHLTRDEVRGALQQARVSTEGGLRLAYLLMHAELEGLICSGPRIGKQFTYALLDERVAPARPVAREAALAELAQRFVRSRGPASVDDFAKWSGLTRSDARAGFDSVTSTFEREIVDGVTHWSASAPRAVRHAGGTTAHLLSVYDEYVSGYKDRSAMASAPVAAGLKAMGNALTHIVVVDGRVVGTWKRRVDGDVVVIEPAMLERLSPAELRAVAQAGRAYADFLGMRVRIDRPN